jgi:hypothetical protein
METRAIIGISDIHARAFSHGIQAFQNLDGGGAVIFGGIVCGEWFSHFVKSSSFALTEPCRIAQSKARKI